MMCYTFNVVVRLQTRTSICWCRVWLSRVVEWNASDSVPSSSLISVRCFCSCSSRDVST